MKYTIEGEAKSLRIKIEQLGDKQQKVLESLQECAEGRCACPTPQFGKLDSIAISPGAEGVSIELRAKAGETIDHSEIAKCLDYTAQQADKA